MAFIWHSYGIYMACIWHLYGIYEISWDFMRFRTQITWLTVGFMGNMSMGALRIYRPTWNWGACLLLVDIYIYIYLSIYLSNNDIYIYV
jgi:hypothetical protein